MEIGTFKLTLPGPMLRLREAQNQLVQSEKLASLGGHVLVEELVPPGVEALVGVTASPLGPVLTLGPGGILTELVDDVALRLLPVTAEDVEEMVDQTRLGKLLQGLRGAAPADRAALVETVVRLAAVVESWPAGFSPRIQRRRSCWWTCATRAGPGMP